MRKVAWSPIDHASSFPGSTKLKGSFGSDLKALDSVQNSE